jgi:thiamine-phosphate pyrophosphorylase
VATVASAVEGGCRAVVLREKDLTAPERAALARDLSALLEPVDGRLIVASDGSLASAVGTPWVHLAGRDPVPPARFRWGRSAHDAHEAQVAAEEGASYVTVSPVFLSASKPGYGPALGIDGLADLVVASAVPVFALGGVTPQNAHDCFAAGATGVAVMGAIMRAPDPTALVKELLA